MEPQQNFWQSAGTKPGLVLPKRGLILPSLRVGMDLDGVHYNFANSVRHFLLTHYADKPFGDGTYPDPHRWDFFLDWGMDVKTFIRICHEGADAGIIFKFGRTFDGLSKWVFDQIHKDGHTIHVATDRSFGQNGISETHTREFLEVEALHHDSLTFTSDKTSVPTDIFIEDKVENYVALDAAGVEVWLVTRPWNLHLEGARRIDSIVEYPGKVRALARRRATESADLVGV
jgi:hypothetical protein